VNIISKREIDRVNGVGETPDAVDSITIQRASGMGFGKIDRAELIFGQVAGMVKGREVAHTATASVRLFTTL
jgi:hypothetical protein